MTIQEFLEDRILALKDQDEDIVIIKGQSYLVRPATEADIQRVTQKAREDG